MEIESCPPNNFCLTTKAESLYSHELIRPIKVSRIEYYVLMGSVPAAQLYSWRIKPVAARA
jgi:hypothetical protein